MGLYILNHVAVII